METQSIQGEDEDEINEIISKKSEAMILKQASEEIQKLVDNKKYSTNFLENESKNKTKDYSESKSENNILRDQLINQVRTGEITPFQAQKKEEDSKNSLGKTFKESTQLMDLEKFILRQADLARQKKLSKKKKIIENDEIIPKKKFKITEKKCNEPSKSQHKTKNVISNFSLCNPSMDSEPSCSSSSKNIDNEKNSKNNYNIESLTEINSDTKKIHIPKKYNIVSDGSESEYVPSDEYDSEDSDFIGETKEKKLDYKRKNNFLKKANCCNHNSRLKRINDDGDEDIYHQRIKNSGYKRNEPLHKVDGSFKVPLRVWKHLYKYQRVSVRWLWELHTRNLGGLLGDEMGLGKTVQVIAYLAGLDCSELLTDGGRFRGLGPTLIICPATLLEQWVKHFHDWWPILRIVMLHHSSTYEGEVDELLHSLKDSGILVVSYTGVLIHKESLVKYKWHYVILDEGHKIRNPEAKVTKIVKKFLTPHRILLTGSPMQNSLKELWSLFDFILPGKLGTLPAFMEHCAVPITRGGYANASRLQEATALQVATMLKNAITPYMLRRTKFDVQHHVNLPNKNEQVLFCSLSKEQRQLYKEFLQTEDCSYVIHERNERREGGRYRARMLLALSALRKICNHPDLFLFMADQESEEDVNLNVDENKIEKFGYWKRSGKMTVVRSLLKIWKKQGHRVLLFTQSKQMMSILEILVQKEKYNYLKMDGSTPMAQRQTIISRFNKDTSFFVFVLTTRVGGLGVNLTGANRVIIFDPDWNPATDSQARERAWRIGQDKDVTVYRLITAGTIEEKIYHRQVYKILLSNRVLEDPRQRRLFRTTDLTELFNLNEPIPGGCSESEQLFRDSKLSPNKSNFSSTEIAAMKRLASELSKKIGKKALYEYSNSHDDASKDEKKTQAVATNNLYLNSDSSSKTLKVFPISSENSKVNTQIESLDVKNKTNTEIKQNINSKEKCINFKESSDESIESNKRISTKNSDNIRVSKIIEVEEKTESIITNDEPLLISNKSQSKYINDQIYKDNKNQFKHKHKKRKKNKSDNEISAMFEGKRVSCLIGRRLGGTREPDQVDNADDQYVLSKLFSKAAVSSAFQHEKILSNAKLNPDDESPLQRAAKNTASEKMECIKASQKWCWKPNWGKPPEEDYTDDSE